MWEYVKEQFCNYKGINIKGFGAFTYEVKQTLPKPGINCAETDTKSMQQLLLEKKSRHIMRPCFIIEPKFTTILMRYAGKEEVTKPKSQSSIYQKGINMTYCNPYPIAAACSLDPAVVQDGMNAIFKAIFDLISIGQNVVLKTGFCNIKFINKDLSYSFSPEIFDMIKDLAVSESKFIYGVTPIKKTWETKAATKWGNSTLSTLLDRPNAELVRTIDNKSHMLQLMSLDMASTYNDDWYKGK